jgi:hypothetical protein
MQLNNQFYDLTQHTQGTIYGGIFALWQHLDAMPDPPPPILQLRRGYAESPAWYMIQAAEFFPEPLTVSKLRVRDIYASPSLALALLELMASEKWFDRLSDEYRLTHEGMVVMERVKTRAWEPITQLQTYLKETDVETLESLMRRTIDASLDSGDQQQTLCLYYSRHRAPSDDAAALVKINQYCSDYNAFRDDAHMAAFKTFDVDGHVWEAFSYVANDKATTADAIFEQLAYRGFSRADYHTALHDLTARGWIHLENGDYVATENGQNIRQQVEVTTDNIFYEPWECLNKQEISQLHQLMTQLGDELTLISERLQTTSPTEASTVGDEQ